MWFHKLCILLLAIGILASLIDHGSCKRSFKKRGKRDTGEFNFLEFTKEMQKEARDKKLYWTPRVNPDFLNLTSLDIFGVVLSDKQPPNGTTPARLWKRGTIPPEFDARTAFPNCPSIGSIRYQGGCGSCWAVSGASVISDRLCVKQSKQVYASAVQLASCTDDADGCKGGDPRSGFDYFVNNGLVTGGDKYSYPTAQPNGCLPYDAKNLLPYLPPTPDPTCAATCTTGESFTKIPGEKWKTDWLTIGQDEPLATRVQLMQQEIMANGPVVAMILAFSDLSLWNYNSRVYKSSWISTSDNPSEGKFFGCIKVNGTDKCQVWTDVNHAVKLIGWGVDSSSGEQYWLVANSWGGAHGENGVSKFLRGKDHLFIEQWAVKIDYVTLVQEK